MSDGATSVQRSFRLSAATSALLDQLTQTANESRNSLVERLLAEALRTEGHPLIRFRVGASGRREPTLIGTRLLVRQVVSSLKDAHGRVDETAEYLGIPVRSVRAAVSYYADFAEEIDADAEWTARVEADGRARWERAQVALA